MRIFFFGKDIGFNIRYLVVVSFLKLKEYFSLLLIVWLILVYCSIESFFFMSFIMYRIFLFKIVRNIWIELVWIKVDLSFNCFFFWE